MAMNLKYDAQGDAPKRLLLETYGCQMNVADSEVVASVMGMAGYELCKTAHLHSPCVLCVLCAPEGRLYPRRPQGGEVT